MIESSDGRTAAPGLADCWRPERSAIGVGSKHEYPFAAVGGADAGSAYAAPRSHVPEAGQVTDGSLQLSSGNDPWHVFQHAEPGS